MDSFWNLQLIINLALQNLGSWLTLPMKLFSFFGQEEFYLVAVPAIYWCIDTRAGLEIGIMLILTTGINTILKLAFHGPRPYWISQKVIPISVENTFGFPSNHAMVSSSVWGLATLRIKELKKNKFLRGPILAIIGLIGLSRIYLGVHFTTDVLAGWILGGFFIFVFEKFRIPAARWWVKVRLPYQLTLIAASSLGLIGLALGARASLANWTIPDLWMANTGGAINPLGLSDIFTSAGLWFGLCAGAAWSSLHGGFNPGGTPDQKLFRYCAGLLGLGLIWYGLGSIFPRSETVLSYTLRYFRYALCGAWVTAWAPILFRALRLID